MEKRILLPTDFSDNSWSAIVYALKLYKDVACVFHFLHAIAIESSAVASLSSKLLKEMKEKALKELLELKDMAEKSNINSNHRFEIIISAKDLNPAIEMAVKTYEIELIIMGTQGATGTEEFLS